MIGPVRQSRPRTSSAIAASRSHARARDAGGSIAVRAWRRDGRRGSPAAAPPRPRAGALASVDDAGAASRARARRGRPFPLDRARPRPGSPTVISASCSSSASRGSGRASSRTRSMAADRARRVARVAGISAAARLHRVAPPLLERRIVEERVRPRVEDLVREHRRLGRVARDQPQLAAVDAAEHGVEPVEVHRLLEAVAHRLRDQRMIGNLAIAGDVLEAGRGIGKDRRHQIVGQHPLQLRRDLAAAAGARHGERDRRVPAPARLEHRRVEERLHEHVARRLRMQIAEHVRQRERVLRPEREQQRVFGRRRLQLEVELAAEPLAQRQPPRLVDAAAERRVQDELHAARLVEEALEDERVLRRNHAERAAAIGEVRRRPVRAAARVRPGLGREPGRRRCVSIRPARRAYRALDRSRAQIADRARQLVAARRRLAEPERNRRRRALARRPRGRCPPVTCRIRHDALPSWKTSPAFVSMAKSSFSVPMNVSSRIEDDAVVGDLRESRRRTSARAAARRAGRAQCR